MDPTPTNGQVSIVDPTPLYDQINTTGLINDGQYLVHTIANFICHSDSVLLGSSSSICQPSGMWNPPPPRCIQGNELINLQKPHVMTTTNTPKYWNLPKRCNWFKVL